MNKIKNFLFKILTKYVEHPLERRGLGRIKFFDKAYKLIFGAVVPEMQKVVEINGYKLLLRTGGKWGIGGIAKSILYTNEYEPETTEVFKKLIKKGMNAIDVGANVGYYTMLMSSLVGSEGKVWAFEPETRNYNNLNENRNLNNFRNITAIQKAVSDVEKETILYVSELERGECSLIPNLIRGKEGQLSVSTVILDNELASRIDFMKTDTEGNEYSVLKGAKNILTYNNVRLVVEVFPQSYDVAGYDLKMLIDLLKEYGYTSIYIIDEKGRKVIPIDYGNPSDVSKYKEYSGNILCLKNGTEI